MKVLEGGVQEDRPPTVGLVLGAGGVVGQAYQAGVLAALEREAGWDARSADIIVGTSAGSVTGAALRVGVPATDLAASMFGVPTSRKGGALLKQILPDDSPLPTPSVGALLRPWRAPSTALIGRALRRPWAFRPEVAAMTLLPRGQVDISDRAHALHDLIGDEWPEGLWICAARRRDGGRVVFGREGSPPAPLAAAVLASCAIPGYFTPITIGKIEYFDGGVHSATNADVLRNEHLDTVVVLSSMSAARGGAIGVDGFLRWSFHLRLEREIERLEAQGSTVIRLEPGPESRHAMGLWAMAEHRGPRVVEVAYEETRKRLLASPFMAAVGRAGPASAAG
jgi:NTE family protein